jgi:hypothetical protein
MTKLRRNEFIDLLEMNELLFIEMPTYVKASIPKIGDIQYYSKSDKIQICKINKWEVDGFNFIKTHLKKITENLYTEKELIEYSNHVLTSKNTNITPKEYFKQQPKLDRL